MNEVNLVKLKETDSTNKYIRTVTPRPACVIAERQTAGRGRLGRSFASPTGGLYMSFTREGITPGDALTARAAVAVCRAVEKLTGLRTGIKWVNDIYVNGRKLCGILAEGVWQGESPDYAIIGVGVNLSGPLPEELRSIATTVEECGGRVPETESLALEIMAEFDRAHDFREEYRSRMILIGKRVTVHRGNETFPATAESLDGDCHMLLRLDDGTGVTLDSGEISIREE